MLKARNGLALALVILALAGCGRKAALEPPSAAVTGGEPQTNADDTIANPDRRFILDGLIE